MKKVIKKISKNIHAKVCPSINVFLKNGCVVLEGQLDNWHKIVQAGRLAVHRKSLGVINNIKLENFNEKIKSPTIKDKLYENLRPDIVIIGGGVVGCAIARELSKYQVDTMLLEKDYDVAMGASSRNDGDIHVGIDLHRNQQKFFYNSRGNKMYGQLAKDLHVDYHQTGHIAVLKKKWERFLIYPLFKLKAKLLGISGVRYMKREELLKIEPGLPSWSSGGIFFPSGGEISPYKLTVALAENAVMNGVKVCLNTIVTDIDTDMDAESKELKIKAVHTNRGTIYPRLVINAAGVFADKIAEMAGDRTFTIHPRKGTNIILDTKCRWYASTSMNKSPFIKFEEDKKLGETSKYTKGGGIVHTVDNNVLIGPTAEEVPEREDYTTNKEEIDFIVSRMRNIAEDLNHGDIITYFSGTRAPTYEEDFVVRKGIFTKNIIQAAGIQSPGLTAAPAIAEDVTNWAIEILGNVEKNKLYNPIRKCTPQLSSLPKEERDKFIKQNADYGEIVCRCEEVSKGEIIDCLQSPIPVYTLDAIKRRVRPGMGRCQGGFCSPLVLSILAKEKGVKIEEITKANEQSQIIFASQKGSNEQ